MASHFLAGALEDAGRCGLRVERTGAWLVSHLHLALDSEQRRRGLLGRSGLEDGEGLVIAPCQGVHTFGMAFPIDVIGVARDGTVVRIRRDVRPRRLVLSFRAFAILEMAAGAAERAGVRVGDRLSVSRFSLANDLREE